MKINSFKSSSDSVQIRTENIDTLFQCHMQSDNMNNIQENTLESSHTGH